MNNIYTLEQLENQAEEVIKSEDEICETNVLKGDLEIMFQGIKLYADKIEFNVHSVSVFAYASLKGHTFACYAYDRNTKEILV